MEETNMASSDVISRGAMTAAADSASMPIAYPLVL
jgi:hypothetical protein